MVNAYTFEPENPDALTKKEKSILKKLGETEKQYVTEAYREVFHNNGRIIPRLKAKYFGRALGAFGALTSNSYEEVCSLDVDDILESCRYE